MAEPEPPKPQPKPINWRGSSLKDLRNFPDDAKAEAGHQLYIVQCGEYPEHYKPMPSVGNGVHEIVVNNADGWFRVMYVAKFEEAVYVLHSFQKKTNKTAQGDLDIAEQRYRAMIQERKANEDRPKKR
jgi:phage-related protein